MSAASKHSFDSIYDDPSPRGYFETLSALDYRSHDFVLDWVQARSAPLGPDATVVDVGCSYGVNSMALKHRRSFRDANALIAAEPDDRLTDAFAAIGDGASCPTVVGIDVSHNATGFATRAGLLDHAVVRDLNAEDLTAGESDLLAGASLVVASGIFSYLRGEGFARVFAATNGLADAEFIGWPLYGEEVSVVTGQLAELGKDVEHDQTQLYPQRRYATDVERDHFRVIAERQDLPFAGTAADEALCVTELVAR